MILALTLVCLLGYAILLRRLAGLPIGAALLVATAGVLLVQFGLALIGGLGGGTTLLRIGGVLAAGSGVWAAWKGPRGRVRWADWAPAISFVLFAVLHSVIFRDAALRTWDEFGHWGVVAREVLALDGLAGSATSTSASHYPPGIAVWIHFVLDGSAFTEGGAYTAQFLLLLAPGCCLLDGLRGRHVGWALGVPVLLAMLLANLGHGVASLLADHVLAMFLGGTIVAMLGERGGSGRYAIYSVPLAVLPLVKEIGIFCALVGALCGIVVVWFRTNSLRAPLWRKECGLAIAALAALLVVPLPGTAAWSRYVETVGLRAGGGIGDRPLSQGARALFTGADGYRAGVRKRYTTVLLEQPIEKSAESLRFNEFAWNYRHRYAAGRRIPLAGMVAFFALLMVGRAFLARGRERRLFLALGGALLLSEALYLVQLGLLYMALFTLSTAIRIASFVRYSHILLLPMMLVGFGAYWPVASREETAEVRKGAVVLVGLLTWILVSPPHLSPLWTPYTLGERKGRVFSLAQPVKAALRSGDPIYVVSDIRDNGFVAVVVRYALLPAHAVVSAPEVGSGRGEDFRERLGRFRYLWLYSVDHGFADRYPEIARFAAEHPTRLFRVGEREGVTGDSEIALYPVP